MINRDNQKTLQSLTQVANKYSLLYSMQLDCNGLLITPSEAQILECIVLYHDKHMREIAYRIGISKAAVSKAIKKMGLKGYISLTPNAMNKKFKDIEITTEGNHVYKQYQKFMSKNFFNEFFAELDKMNEVSRQSVDKLLRIMNDLLDDLKA